MATLLRPVPFRFDHASHAYYVGDRQIPNVTGMLQKVGKVDPRYYRDEHRERGRAVHQLTSEFDLGALDLATLRSPYRGYVLAHAEAVKRLKPKWLAIEEPVVHPRYLFGTRPDRIGKIFGVVTIVDEKSGGKESWHPIQTALQAIGAAWKYGLAPEAIPRACLYVSGGGEYKYDPHPRRSDLDEAFRVIKECC